MAEPVPVILGKEGVSDDSFLFTEAVKPEGAPAEAGECIARVETSKATVDITAPCAGHVYFRFPKGAEIPVGEAIAVIAGKDYAGPSAAAAPAAAASAPAAPAAASAEASPTRFTPLAKKVMAELNLDHALFSGGGRVNRDRVMEMARLGGADAVPEPGPLAAPAGSKPRFSQAALSEAERLGLSPDAFAGEGLVTREDVRRRAGLAAPVPASAGRAATPAAAAPQTAPVAAPQAPLEGGARIPLSKAKKNEILYLSEGQKGTLASAISILVSGHGFFDPATGRGRGTLQAILVYETSRLLRAFPDFNACFDGDAVVQWPRVNIGVAFEIDAGLKVPIVRDADLLGVDAIKAVLDGHVLKYLENRLALEDLEGGTFTITDLSGEGVFTFLPLINRRQSAILGVGGCQPAPGSAGAFPLTLAFDHRVSTGRKASELLRALKERLESYGPVLAASAPAASAGTPPAAKSCCVCRREEGELRERQYLLAIQRQGKADLICSTCFKGW